MCIVPGSFFKLISVFQDFVIPNLQIGPRLVFQYFVIQNDFHWIDSHIASKGFPLLIRYNV